MAISSREHSDASSAAAEQSIDVDHSVLWSAPQRFKQQSKEEIDRRVHDLYCNLRPRDGTSVHALINYRDEDEAFMSLDDTAVGAEFESEEVPPDDEIVRDAAVQLRPYSTPLRVADRAGRVITLDVLREILLHERRCALSDDAQQRAVVERLRAAVPARRDRARLLRALNRTLRYECNSLPFMRGCVQCPVTDFVTHGRTRGCAQPIARIFYWLCRARERPEDELLERGLTARFKLITRCNTRGCVNPEHYEHLRERPRKRAKAGGTSLTQDFFASMMDNQQQKFRRKTDDKATVDDPLAEVRALAAQFPRRAAVQIE